MRSFSLGVLMDAIFAKDTAWLLLLGDQSITATMILNSFRLAIITHLFIPKSRDPKHRNSVMPVISGKQRLKKASSWPKEELVRTPQTGKAHYRSAKKATNECELILDSSFGSVAKVAVAHRVRHKWVKIKFENSTCAHCKPRTERLFSILLEEDPDVFGLIKPPFNQLGLFWKACQRYSPDSLLAATTGKYVVEAGALDEVNNKKTASKACEGIRWRSFSATANQDQTTREYRLISPDNTHPGNTSKYTLGTAHSIKEN